MPIVPPAQPTAPQAPQIDPVFVAMASSEVASMQKRRAAESHLDEANSAMSLTSQERALYNLHLKNLHGAGGVDNPDGSRSTLRQSTFEIGGKHYNIPTVWEGKILDPKNKNDMDQIKQNVNRIGLENFPSYKTQEEAEKRYDQMHGFMEKDTADFMRKRKK